MVNWYGINGIYFHFNGPWDDPEITFKGVRDRAGVIVEEIMWERFTEDCLDIGTVPESHKFGRYMLSNSDEVKHLIAMARGEFDV